MKLRIEAMQSMNNGIHSQETSSEEVIIGMRKMGGEKVSGGIRWVQ